MDVGTDSAGRLLAKARRGEQGCLGQLLSLYRNYLHILAATHLDRRLQAKLSSSDVVQDAFYQAYSRFDQFRGQSQQEFAVWLRQILARRMSQLCDQFLGAEKRDVRREVSLAALEHRIEGSAFRLEAVLADRGNSPSGEVGHRESARILADQLAELPPDYQQVIVLRHLECLPFEQVAERMERSCGAVRMLWMRAIRELRNGLRHRGMQ